MSVWSEHFVQTYVSNRCTEAGQSAEPHHRAKGQLFAVLCEIECPLGSGGSTRFGHLAEYYERLLTGVELDSRKDAMWDYSIKTG